MGILKKSKLDFFPPKKGKENREFFLSILSKIFSKQYLGDDGINESLKKILSLKLKNQLIFLLSDKIDQIDLKLLQILNYNNELIYVNIFDSLELHLEKKNMSYSFL
jgi:hypothetical protein